MEYLSYLYGFIPTSKRHQNHLPSLQGFDGETELYMIEDRQITAILCALDPDDYSEEIIKSKIDQDMEWLKSKAFHHHETLISLYKVYPDIIPSSFCTIYESEQNVKKTIRENEDKLMDIFDSLDGNQEWNLKIYLDEKKWKGQGDSPAVEEMRRNLDSLSPGKRFFEKKKLDQLIEQEMEKEKNTLCEDVHDRLKKYSQKAEVKRNWNKDVTGMNERMAWNSVFLLPDQTVDSYLEEIKSLQKDLNPQGWKFEVSGPWPAYHFSGLS
ncbi:GvpL/GvpF family gas vesicle protein [Pseudalkalibacillus sp. Hm43]|uniref:GvpL/GvpF family gas vesicle protein n=1 Tax=Pseudalkalibacillus sp. Hm43 TaxID=3450742 RepID=UPI003F440A35